MYDTFQSQSDEDFPESSRHRSTARTLLNDRLGELTTGNFHIDDLRSGRIHTTSGQS
jgi:hypothetical protein